MHTSDPPRHYKRDAVPGSEMPSIFVAAVAVGLIVLVNAAAWPRSDVLSIPGGEITRPATPGDVPHERDPQAAGALTTTRDAAGA
jgi:hypothetical protein